MMVILKYACTASNLTLENVKKKKIKFFLAF